MRISDWSSDVCSSDLGRVTIFAWRTIVRALAPPYYPIRLLEQLLLIGWFSLPVVGLTAVFTGAALAQQIYVGGSRLNAQSAVPAIVVIGIVRELGPVLVGLMVAGRVSSSRSEEHTSELQSLMRTSYAVFCL